MGTSLFLVAIRCEGGAPEQQKHDSYISVNSSAFEPRSRAFEPWSRAFEPCSCIFERCPCPQSNSQPAFPLGSIVSLYCSSQEVLCQIVRGISPEEPSNATVITWQERVRKRYGFYIGVGFTFLSCLLIGGSVILKKKGLIRLVATGATRAGRAPGAGGIG